MNSAVAVTLALVALPIPILAALVQQRLFGWRVERLRSVAKSLDPNDPSKPRIERHAAMEAGRLAEKLDVRVPATLAAAFKVYFGWVYFSVAASPLGRAIGGAASDIGAQVDYVRSLGFEQGAGFVYLVLALIGLPIVLAPYAVIAWASCFYGGVAGKRALPTYFPTGQRSG